MHYILLLAAGLSAAAVYLFLSWLVGFVRSRRERKREARRREYYRSKKPAYSVPRLQFKDSTDKFPRKSGCYEVACVSTAANSAYGAGEIQRYDWFNPNYHNLSWDEANKIMWEKSYEPLPGLWEFCVIDEDGRLVATKDGYENRRPSAFIPRLIIALFIGGAVGLIVWGVQMQ